MSLPFLAEVVSNSLRFLTTIRGGVGREADQKDPYMLVPYVGNKTGIDNVVRRVGQSAFKRNRIEELIVKR